MDRTRPIRPPSRASRSQDKGCVVTRTARGILLAALICYLGITFLNLLSLSLDAYDLTRAVICLATVFLLQLVHSGIVFSGAQMRTRAVTLAAQGVLSFLPLLWFGVYWGAMAGFFAGSLLLVLPTAAGWSLYGATALSMIIPGILADRGVIDTVYLVQTTALTGLVVYGLSRLTGLVDQLTRARADLARLAVSNEQLRFSRDLHDLLGYSLSAISLKNELVRRLIPANPCRACEEVDEILVISRQALADVRRVASGYREMSLASELASAESVLTAADVSVTIDTQDADGDLGVMTSTVLATVLREGVTNLLRHSKASSCWISTRIEDGVARLAIVNDGLATTSHPRSPHSGSGLSNLEQRLDDIGGRLLVQRVTDDSDTDLFRLTAEAPAREQGNEQQYGRTDNVA
jgi:two-component system sensor histidine kinase DesK